MADSIGGLFLRLGLSLDELESDFIAAEKTTRENMARLNRESNLIKLRAEVEIGNLDAVSDATQILAVKENALNEQLAIQRDKVKLAEAAYQDLLTKHGEGAAVSQKAAAALEREKLSLQRLQGELQNVRKAQDDLNKSQGGAKTSNSLLDMYQGLKGEVGGSLGKLTSAFNDLRSASNSADGAITKSLEIIGSIPHPAGKAVAALASIPLVMQGVENSLLDIAKPAISAGDSFYVMSKGLQMSIAETSQLSMICKVTGIEINEVIGTMRRLNMQLVNSNGTDNKLTKALRQYGVEARNANGELKNAYEMSLALAKGLQKAKEAGREKEFIASALGRSASGDVVTYLLDLADNIEQAKKVVKNRLSDPVKAHALQGELNTLEAQAGQLKSAFSSAFMPIAETIIPHTTERLGALTQVIADNADGIKSLAGYVGTFVDKIGGAANDGVIKLIQLAGSLGEFFKSSNKTVDKYLNDKDINSVEDLVHKELLNYQPLERLRIEKDPLLYQQTIEFFTPIYQDIADAREQVEKEGKKVGEAVRDSTYESFHSLKGLNFENPDSILKSFEETKKLSDELYKLKHTDYENQILDVYRWQEKLLQAEETTAEQREIIAQISAEKIAKIEKQKADEIEKEQKRVQDLWQSAADIEYGLTHSAFEKQLHDIERWKEAQLEKSKTAEETAAIIANTAAKEADAFQREMDRIQGRIESAQDKLFRLTHSQKDYDLYQAQKEYNQYIKDGVPQELAKAVYDATVADINSRAREDNGGSYTKSKNQSDASKYFVEFDKPQQKDWTQVNAGQLAFDTLAQSNQRVANSAREVIGAQRDLVKSINETADGIEIIEGDRVVNRVSSSNAANTQQKLQNALNQTPNYSMYRDKYLGELPDLTRRVSQGMANGSIQKMGSGYGAGEGYEEAMYNFKHSLLGLGLSNSQAMGYLDKIYTGVEQLRETEVKPTSGPYQHIPGLNVSPNINIDLGGAYVFDDAMKKQLIDDVTNETVNAVKDAFQQAKSQASYGYGN